MRLFGFVQAFEKSIIRTAVDFPQRNQHADADVQFASLVFFICRAANVAAHALQLRAQLLLRKPAFQAKFAQVVAHGAVASEFLFHFSSRIDQYWLQLWPFYAILKENIDRYIGQKYGVIKNASLYFFRSSRRAKKSGN